MPNDGSSTTSATEDSGAESTATVELKEASDPPPGSADSEDAASPMLQLASPASPAEHPRIPQEDIRPPLPPRPTNIGLLQDQKVPQSSSLKTGSSPRPQLQSTATTAISRTDINTHSYQDGSRETFATTTEPTPPQKSSPAFGSMRRMKGLGNSEGGDTASIRSFAPTLNRWGDNESLLGDVFGAAQDLPAWKLFGEGSDDLEQSEARLGEDNSLDADFVCEFDSIKGVAEDRANEGD